MAGRPQPKEAEPVMFRVYGVPVPQGSMRAFLPRGGKRPIITADNSKLKPWRQQVSGMAIDAMKNRALFAAGVPVLVDVRFYFDKPKSTKKGAYWKTTKPDIDKLLRATLDSLTGIVFADDAQVAQCIQSKSFDSPARAEIYVARLE